MGDPEVGPGPHAPAQSSLPQDLPLGVHRGRPPNSPTSGGLLGTATQRSWDTFLGGGRGAGG